MAQSGYTPLLIYGSGTTGNTPSAGNLTSSAAGAELALNYFDGRLFYKDNAGVVQILAVKMPSGVLPVANGGTGLASYAAGDLLYATGATTLAKLTVGAVSTILTSSGTAPQWSSASGITVGTATNLAGGVAGSLPYQTGAGATTFLGIGAANRVLTSTGSAPQWVTSLTGLTGVSSSGLTNTSLTSGRVVYSTTGGAQTDSANLTFDGSTLTVNSVNVGRGGGAISSNTAVGTAALAGNTTGTNSVAVGFGAAGNSTTASNITAVGNGALNSLSTGSDNTAIGIQAMATTSTASQNTSVGANSLFSNSVGNRNVAVGFDSARLLTGGESTAIGWRALYLATTSNFNTAVGSQALYSNTTASNNTALGYQAGYSNTTGANNSWFGFGAGYTVTTGTSNVFLGYQAGYTSNGSGNICIGVQAGYALTTGSNNTFVGGGTVSAAGGVITTGSKNTLLGAYNGNQGGLDIRTSSNNIVLSDGDGNPRLQINSSGNVGINTSVQYHFLQVNGAASTANNISIAAAFKQNSSNSDAITAIGIGVENASFVKGGIGWQRVGSNYDTGSLIFYNRSTADSNSFTSSDARLIINSSGQMLVTGAGTAALPVISKSDDLNTGIFFPAADTLAASTNGSERMRIDSSGNVVVTGSGGLGYGTGSGGAVTQATSRTTGVTLNKTNGQITLVSAAGTAAWQSFTVTNSTVAATDVVIVNQDSGTDLYQIFVTNVAAGSFRITFATTGGTTTEQPVFGFAVIKAVTA